MTKAGHWAFGSNTSGCDESGWLRIEDIAAIAHIHLGLEMRRLEMIIADLEHLPEGHVRIGAMPRQVRRRHAERISLDLK